MNRKGSAFSEIGKAILVLAILVISIYLVRNVSKTTYESINSCEERGGLCQATCIEDKGENILFEGKGTCEYGVCCTSDAIKKMLQEKVLPYRDRSVTVKIEGIRGEFQNGVSLPLFIGGIYDFEIHVNEGRLRDKPCEVTLEDSNSRPLQIGDWQTLYENEPCTYTNTKLDLPTDAELENSDRQGRFNFKGVRFYDRYEDRTVALTVKFFNDEERTEDSRILTARFPLDLKWPVNIAGPGGNWGAKDRMVVECLSGSCKEAILGRRADSTCVPILPPPWGAVSFEGRQAEFPINFENQTPREMEIPLCMIVSLENDEKIMLSLTKPLRIDTKAPVITGMDRTHIKCEDGGSGCDEYYYMKLGGVSAEDFIESYNQGGATGLAENYMTELANNLLGNLINRFTGGPCPRPGHSDYRRTRNSFVGMGGDVLGTFCIYAVDKAGNANEPKMYEVMDIEDVKREISERIITDKT